MLKDQKHIKKSKGLRLHWLRTSTVKNALGYRVSLTSKFLEPLLHSDQQVNQGKANPDQKLLVP